MDIKKHNLTTTVSFNETEKKELDNIISLVTSEKTIQPLQALVRDETIVNYTMTKLLDEVSLDNDETMMVTIVGYNLSVNLIKLSSVYKGVTYNIFNKKG